MNYDSQNGESFELLSGENIGVDGDEFIKYNGDSEEWRVTFDAMQSLGTWTKVDDGYAVYGRNLGVWDSTLLAYVENDGQVRYIKDYDLIQKSDSEDSHIEQIEAIFQNEDGTLTIISNAINSYIYENPGFTFYLNITVIDTEGNVIRSNTTAIDWMDIINVTKVADGYLLQVTNDSDDNRNVVLKVDRDGNYVSCFELNEIESIYKVTDITEVDGDVYISSYVVPESDGKFVLRGNYIPASAKAELTDSEINISDEELLDKVKDNYTAMLLVCDSDDGKVKEFYSVDGAVGANINVSTTGEIVWDVKNIAEASIRNHYERYEMSAVCSISRYLISGNGEVSSIEDTNKFSRHTDYYYRRYSKEEQLEIFKETYGMSFEEYRAIIMEEINSQETN